MVEKKRESVRLQEGSQRRVLDPSTRQRRLTRQLEALEKDNFQEDPNSGLPLLAARLPQFDSAETQGKRKKKTRGDHFKLRFRKTFQSLLEEENLSVSEGTTYFSASVPPSALPARHFCTLPQVDRVTWETDSTSGSVVEQRNNFLCFYKASGR
uniref:zinc finger HIT domain-containing protein 1 isoform X2 n=1 Tax=Myxine glutinosa TaxID=7769 RepID=UPI00358F459E